MESLGLEALEIPTHPRDGIALDALAFAPNYNNPLGYCMADDAKRALIRLLGKHKVPLIEDDVYGDAWIGHS